MKLTIGGWIFLIVVWGIIIALVWFSMARVLFPGKRKE